MVALLLWDQRSVAWRIFDRLFSNKQKSKMHRVVELISVNYELSHFRWFVLYCFTLTTRIMSVESKRDAQRFSLNWCILEMRSNNLYPNGMRRIVTPFLQIFSFSQLHRSSKHLCERVIPFFFKWHNCDTFDFIGISLEHGHWTCELDHFLVRVNYGLCQFGALIDDVSGSIGWIVSSCFIWWYFCCQIVRIVDAHTQFHPVWSVNSSTKIFRALSLSHRSVDFQIFVPASDSTWPSGF